MAFEVTYTLTYTVSDAAGNFASAERQIVVHHLPDPDDKPPVLTQNGSNPIILHLGAPYVEQGASMFDGDDGDISSLVNIKGSADTSVARIYEI